MFDMPRSLYGKVGSIAFKMNAVPFQTEYFFTTQTCIQAEHDKNIGRQSLDCGKELFCLLIGESILILLWNTAFFGEFGTRGVVNDVAFFC